MFVLPLEGHLSPAKTALADRLQWARSSIRKKLDMGGQQETPKPVTPKAKEEKVEKKDVKPQEQVALVDSQALTNGVLHHKDEKDCAAPINGDVEGAIAKSETDVESRPIPSPERHTITHGDPLGALDVKMEAAKPTPVTSPEPKTPAKLFVLPDLSVRLFAKSRSSSSSSASSTEDSSSDDDSSEDSESEEESDHSHDNVSSSASRLSFR